jgi:hypothetical protein
VLFRSQGNQGPGDGAGPVAATASGPTSSGAAVTPPSAGQGPAAASPRDAGGSPASDPALGPAGTAGDGNPARPGLNALADAPAAAAAARPSATGLCSPALVHGGEGGRATRGPQAREGTYHEKAGGEDLTSAPQGGDPGPAAATETEEGRDAAAEGTAHGQWGSGAGGAQGHLPAGVVSANPGGGNPGDGIRGTLLRWLTQTAGRGSAPDSGPSGPPEAACASSGPRPPRGAAGTVGAGRATARAGSTRSRATSGRSNGSMTP